MCLGWLLGLLLPHSSAPFQGISHLSENFFISCHYTNPFNAFIPVYLGEHEDRLVPLPTLTSAGGSGVQVEPQNATPSGKHAEPLWCMRVSLKVICHGFIKVMKFTRQVLTKGNGDVLRLPDGSSFPASCSLLISHSLYPHASPPRHFSLGTMKISPLRPG